MVAIRDLLVDNLACSPEGPIGQADLIPRDSPDTKGCACPGGRAWLRWGGNNTVGIPPNCTKTNVFQLGVYRCYELTAEETDDPTVDDIATPAEYFIATTEHLGDLLAIETTLNQIGKGVTVGNIRPSGPQGGCMGIIADFSILCGKTPQTFDVRR
jgi:hypothetical protein